MEPHHQRRRVLLVGPGPPAMGGIASVLDAIAASGVGERFALERFVTSARHAPPYGLAGRALSAARARGLGFDGAFDLEARAQLRDFAAALATRPSLVHLHCSHGWDFWLSVRIARLARRANVPALLHSHGNFDVEVPRWSALRRALFPRALRVPQRLVVLSESWKRWFAQHLDPARIEVVYNGIDTRRFPPGAHAAENPTLRLLFVGTRDPAIKGADVVLAALPEIARAVPQLRLVMAGEDPERLEARRVHGTPLADCVRFVGRQDAAAMPALYADADLLLLPSRREVSPMALLEAMSAGLPVVASRVGAIPEVLGDAGGALIDAGDASGLARAVIALARDPARRARIGAANRARAIAEFDHARLGARLAALYDAACA